MLISTSRKVAVCISAIGVITTIALSMSGTGRAQSAAQNGDELAGEFNRLQPLFRKYCFDCHSGDLTEAEVDLAEFMKVADIERRPKAWIRVREMLDSGQMPPKDSPRPTDQELGRMRNWVRSVLQRVAEKNAGDPGPVVLRRLSNAEYTYTIRDLTGVPQLDPAREFPVDGAAGEGFTNTGAALVMSPALVRKYLDAAKQIADHAVLLPDRIEFSSASTRRDKTDQWLAKIRTFYDRFAPTGKPVANSMFDVNVAARLPFEDYIAATLNHRDALMQGTTDIATVSRERGLNAPYLDRLWQTLTEPAEQTASVVLEDIKSRWRRAKPDDTDKVVAAIVAWQRPLWKFNAIGHIGREGGPTSWMEPVDPIVPARDFKVDLAPPSDGSDIVVTLSASDAGDGNAEDFVVWKSPRLAGGGEPDLLLRDLADLKVRMEQRRRVTLSLTEKCLAAATDVQALGDEVSNDDIAKVAAQHKVAADLLVDWVNYLGFGPRKDVPVTGHFVKRMEKASNYAFINGWGSGDTPLILGNSSDQSVRIPGFSRPHSVVVHPSPSIFAAVGWRSPMTGIVRIESKVVDAHPECGNGVEWVLQHHTRKLNGTLATDVINRGGTASIPAKTVSVREGELVVLLIGPRDGNHACDLTEINLVIHEKDGEKRVWDLAKDESSDLSSQNPGPDRFDNPNVWHFFRGPMADVKKTQPAIDLVPPGSLLAKWRTESDRGQRNEIAATVQKFVLGPPPKEAASPDGLLYRQLRRIAALYGESLLDSLRPDERFGRHPIGHAVRSEDLVVRAPASVTFRIPEELAEGRALVVSGTLDAEHGNRGSVQLNVGPAKSVGPLNPNSPAVALDKSAAREKLVRAFARFRELFPPALCYTRIVPVDEVVTLTLFYREDEPLQRLMLTDDERRQLDQLWDELIFVSREPLRSLVAFEQISEFATQDRPDLVIAFKALTKPLNDRADAYRKRQRECEPAHVRAVVRFAESAWRRPLAETERLKLNDLYSQLRRSEVEHERAIRLTLARVLTSPAFLYRREEPQPGQKPTPVTANELANRLSYFLWSSMPDDELLRVAASGALNEGNGPAMGEQTRRMLKDERTRRLAIQFACQWLHIRDFDQHDDKNEALFPEFAELRGSMYEESVRFFTDLFQNDGSILDLLTADHTFLNGPLAKHYGIPWNGPPNEWRRVESMTQRGRGGVLGMATTLAMQSGASRTSPILRGNWVFETLLGERLPRPPADVPQLPDAPPTGVTARELIEKHSSVPECAKCHARIDPYGFALEQYDAIGRLRLDPVDTRAKLPDGTKIVGMDGLRTYLSVKRRNDFVRQFCRKLLGYALGRETQLSDEPLLVEMQHRLELHDFRFSVAVETIVNSPQFRGIRGRDARGPE